MVGKRIPYWVAGARSHTRIASSPPLTTVGRPSNSVTATARTGSGVTGERVADLPAGGQVPDPHRVVGASADSHWPAVQLCHRHRPHRTPACPVNGSPIGFPPAKFHTLTDASKLPLTTTGRSNSATATERTGPVWPMNGSPTGLPVARSQTLTGVIIAATDYHRPAIQLRHRDRTHRTGMARERVADRAASSEIPDPYRSVVAAADHHGPASTPPPRPTHPTGVAREGSVRLLRLEGGPIELTKGVKDRLRRRHAQGWWLELSKPPVLGRPRAHRQI